MVTRTPESKVSVVEVVALVPVTDAVIVIVVAAGTVEGEMYSPFASTVPTVAFPLGVVEVAAVKLFTDQLTVFVEPATVAVNCSELFTNTVGVVGEMVTVTAVLLPHPAATAPASAARHSHRVPRLILPPNFSVSCCPARPLVRTFGSQ